MPDTPTAEAQAYADAVHLVEEWQRRLDNAGKRADGRTGADIVTDPSKAADVARSRAQAAEEARVATEALQAARQRQEAAARALVVRQADDLQPVIDKARATVDAHHHDTAKLLEQLSQHTGQSWSPVGYKGIWTPEIGTQATVAMRDTIDGLTAQQAALRAAAAGADPLEHVDLDHLPLVLAPGGELPTPSLVVRAEADQAREAEAAAWRGVLVGYQAEVNEAAARLGIDPPTVLDSDHDLGNASVNVRPWRDQLLRSGKAEPPSDFDVIVSRCGMKAAFVAFNEWERQQKKPAARA